MIILQSSLGFFSRYRLGCLAVYIISSIQECAKRFLPADKTRYLPSVAKTHQATPKHWMSTSSVYIRFYSMAIDRAMVPQHRLIKAVSPRSQRLKHYHMDLGPVNCATPHLIERIQYKIKRTKNTGQKPIVLTGLL
jgi:hypothetical protein